MDWIKISDLAEVITGGTPSTSVREYWDNGTVPWLQSGCCQNCVIDSCDTFITEKGLEHSAAKMMKPDSVLIALTGATTGKVGYLTFEACANQSVTGIQPNEKFESKYLYYFLLGMRDKILADSYGGAQKHISQGYVKNILFPMISITQQRDIVSILDETANIISVHRKQLNSLDTLIKARFVEMFGDTYNNSKHWIKAPMGDYMTLLTDFSANGSYDFLDSNVKMYDEPNYALMIRTTDLERHDFTHDVKYIDENSYKILFKSRIFGGEIIMNKIGSAGKVYLMPHLDRPVSLGRNAFLFRYTDDINVVFLYHQLTSEYGTSEIMQHVRGAVTKTITKEAARSIRIIVPPIDQQRAFAAFVAQINKSKAVVQKALDEAQTLFNSLMQQYFG